MTRKQDLVSIIMPVYNRAHSVARSIDSVLCQKYHNFELIIIDDGSQDDVKAIISDYTDSRLIFHSLSKNMGVSFARNKGLELCQGNLICFLDSDDEFSSDYLEIMVEYFTKNNVQVLGCLAEYDNYEILPNRSHLEEYQASLDKFGFLLRGNIFPLPCLMFSDALIQDIRFDENYAAYEDYALILHLHSCGYEIQLLLEPLVKVNDSAESVNKDYESIISTLNQLRNYYDEAIAQSNYYRFQLYQNFFGTLRKAKKNFRSIVVLTHMIFYKRFYHLLCQKMLKLMGKGS